MTSFRNLCRLSVLTAAVAALAACNDSARLSVEVSGAPESDIVIRQQNINRYDVLDTVKTDASGHFRYKVNIPKGDPDFIYLYRNGVKIASLLLDGGDAVEVTADTTGNYSVSGSGESEKLRKVDADYSAFTSSMDSLARAINSEKEGTEKYASLSRDMTRLYMDYYRKCVRYVMENSKSLTVVPVFYQTVSDRFYVFSQDTDALHFRSAADSLSTVYPDSKYVKSLSQEAASRQKQLELRVRMQTAESVGYIDIEMPDVKGVKTRLSDIDAKAVLVCFWSPEDAVQKMFNLDVLKGIYDTYRPKGLEIYQAAISSDKPSWERIVTAQGLEWVNVCDGLGQNSPVIGLYNLTKLPAYYLISGDEVTSHTITDEASLRRALKSVF